MRNTIVPMFLAAMACGCGGGASVEPTVTIKLAALDDAPLATEKTTAITEVKGFGILEGRVVLSGTASPLPPLIKKGGPAKDVEVCAVENIPDQSLVIGENNGVGNVFVYMKRKPSKDFGPYKNKEAKLVFDQVRCTFIPHAMIVPCETPLEILNGDSVNHNTRTVPRRNDTVSRIVSANVRADGEIIEYPRAEQEPIAVKCDYHSWMAAYHLPIDHPFASLTTSDGKFRIEGIPSGTHQFQFWHEKAGGFIQSNVKVVIHAGQVATYNVDYALPN